MRIASTACATALGERCGMSDRNDQHASAAVLRDPIEPEADRRVDAVAASIRHDDGVAPLGQCGGILISGDHDDSGQMRFAARQRVEHVFEHQARQTGARGGAEHRRQPAFCDREAA